MQDGAADVPSLEDLGVELESYVLTEPPNPTPLLVEVPHAGLRVDERSARFMTTQVRCLALDADMFVDRIFRRAPSLGAGLLVARMSRHVVDLNAAPERDLDDDTVVDPERRVIYRRIPGLEDAIVERPIPRAERVRRARAYFLPYHAALQSALQRRIEALGSAIVLSVHSWDDRADRAPVDIVLGTLGNTSAAAEYYDAVEESARRSGLTVRRDVPFAGGYSTASYGAPSRGSHALQLEIARRLYLDPKTLEVHEEGFAKLQSFADDLVQALANRR
ncbi:MAG: N-formylglutamate amidohydrolase [Polyangiaceae bacterium]